MTSRPLSSLLIAISLLAPAAHAATRYRVVPVDSLHALYGINNLGDLTGVRYSNNDPRAFVVRNGNATQIPGLANPGTARALAVNDRGEVVGDAMAPLPAPLTGSTARPFLWSAERGTIELTPRSTKGGGFAYALNNLGEAVGYQTDGADNSGAFRWKVREDGSVESHRIGPDGSYGTAWDINDRGFIVGTRFDSAWVYDPVTDEVTDLPLGRRGGAYGINENNEIVGLSSEYDRHAVLWRKEDGAWTVYDLGKLPPPYGSCTAIDLNTAGQGIGECTGGPGVPTTAFVFDRGPLVRASEMLVPADYGQWEISGVFDINERGTIIGTAVRAGETRGVRVLLEPVEDEPARTRAVRRR